MKITVNGKKYEVDDNSTHVTVDSDGELNVWALVLFFNDYFWESKATVTDKILFRLKKPSDFTKCCAKVFDGAVIDFEVG